MQRIDELETYIRSHIIHGATNVAFATLDAMTEFAAAYQGKEPLGPELLKIGERLAYARPAEPLAQNALRFIFDTMEKDQQYYIEKIGTFKNILTKAKQKMAHAGATYIQNGGAYLTHCHSTTVVSMFLQAHQLGKKFSVYVTESRPSYQGRNTARELLAAGIEDVTMLVDSAASALVEKQVRPMDAAFIGAGMLSQHGLVNTIGTLPIAASALRSHIPLFCHSILLKYDPIPFTHSLLEQQREGKIWTTAPEGLKFFNPEYDYIPYEEGMMIICENGTIAGREVAVRAMSLYPFLQSSY